MKSERFILSNYATRIQQQLQREVDLVDKTWSMHDLVQ